MTTMAVARDEGKGHPLVLLHGFPGNSADWTAVADRLVHGHRVIVPDLLGFGASDRPAAFTDLWADAQAEALVAALDARAVGHFALVGHDYGGPVALRLPRRATSADHASGSSGSCTAGSPACSRTRSTCSSSTSSGSMASTSPRRSAG